MYQISCAFYRLKTSLIFSSAQESKANERTSKAHLMRVGLKSAALIN
jgi:hypothetical protein